MSDVVFITGNQRKADYLADYLGHSIEHIKIDLDEIQSLDFREVVRHKVRQAYAAVGRPVLVEDAGIEFAALGCLPGTFTRWFQDELSLEGMCRLLDGKDRAATARCVFGYYDGTNEAYFEGSMGGMISEKPMGVGGFGFDSIFIPEGYTATRAQMNEEDDRVTYLMIKPFEQVRAFLTERQGQGV